MSLPRGRGAILQSEEGVLFIDESYNASPVSVKAAIDNLCLIPSRGRKIAILGGMKELGSYANRFHDEILDCAAKTADQVLIYGSEWKGINKNYKNVLCLQDMEDIVNHLKAILRTGDVVLVKGSRAYEMERIYDWWSLHEL
jgi:UDP-N-acetylmuramoyl-tripeptide--D-alanyl-D-alanine ligase